MKTKLLFILLFSQLASFGQQTEKLVDTTKLWSHLYMTPSPGGPPPHTMTSDYIKFSQDTLVGFNYYKKVLRSTDTNHLTWTYLGIIREDSTDKIYYQGLQDSIERLLYDFNAQVGDTITINNGVISELVVDSIDSIFVYSKFLKRIIFQNSEIWIKGIGSLCGVLQSGRSSIVGTLDELLCYYKNDTLEYSNLYYTNCYYNNVGVADFEKNKITINLFPNPVTETSVFIIENNQDQDHYIMEIYTTIGARIRTMTINKGDKTFINKADFASGLYIFRLITPKSSIVTGKFEIE